MYRIFFALLPAVVLLAACTDNPTGPQTYKMPGESSGRVILVRMKAGCEGKFDVIFIRHTNSYNEDDTLWRFSDFTSARIEMAKQGAPFYTLTAKQYLRGKSTLAGTYSIPIANRDTVEIDNGCD